METSQRWDTAALRMGAMVSLIFAIPFSIGASWAASRDSTALAIWLVLGAIGGFTLGAGCAAWVQRLDLPLSHGLVTAVPFHDPAAVQPLLDFLRRHVVMRVACCIFFYGVFVIWNHVLLK